MFLEYQGACEKVMGAQKETLLLETSNSYFRTIQKQSCKLPISKTRPDKAEQPGPPVNQSIRGSSFGLFSDSMK
jgi:hypothetical protein